MYTPIRDYAIIGNLRSAILVNKNGSIDWAPAPFINSPSIFGSILDKDKGGFWSIAPPKKFTSHQWYDGDTNVLVTQFETDSGVSEVTDFIPIEKEKTFVPEEEDTTFRVHRKVSCTQGVCHLRVVFQPRFDYGRGETQLTNKDGGIYAQNGHMHGVLASRADYEINDNTATTDLTLKEGDSEFLIFRYNTGEIVFSKNEEVHHEKELEETKQFWEDWVHSCDLKQCIVAGEWHTEVVRSSLLLKILFFEPVGTIAAAPTTSLPETIGGVRNWDYRFTWLRDSALTLSALFQLGYIREAEEYVKWIISVCRHNIDHKAGHLQVMYGLQGETNLEEETLAHLDGYQGSKPVRIGNNAYHQEQWDIYGSILDMVWTMHTLREHHVLSNSTWEVLHGFVNHAVRVWRQPDEGLWEVRGGKKHFVYSKVMCWVALDRALKITEAYNLEGERTLWKEEKEKIRASVLSHGWSEKKQSFVQSFDSEDLDASALTFSSIGFIGGDDPKMLKTIDAIERELGVGDGLFCRYTSTDGLPGKEGAFLLASFWFVDALILAGKKERAAEIFEKVLGFSNHVGLFSEEMNPKSKEFLGNFPQAYTHIGLINSAFNLVKSF